ncbi:MAG: phage portal protein [Candidatus Limiplasma sp.]|nr:phage portal protein [Candidatus Limiplasma sp.]
MSKKHRNAHGRSRDAPAALTRETTIGGTSFLCSNAAWDFFCSEEGYRPLTACPEVQMCAAVYADLIGAMTLHLMRNTAQGDVRVKDGLARKLDIEPNRYMTRQALVSLIVWTLLLDGAGNQVTYPRFTPDGLLDELVPLKPSRLSFVANGDSYLIRYGAETFQPDEVLHFVLRPDPEEPWHGTGYNVALGDVVKCIRQANQTKRALLESPTPSLIVKVDGLAEEYKSSDGRRRIANQYLDETDHGRPWFIPSEAFTVEQVKPLTLNDLAIKSNLELDKRSVAAIFGVPAFLVGVGDFKKDEFNAFVKTRVMPRAKLIEQELTRKLLFSPDLYWRFNPRSLYAYDLSEIVQAGSAMVDRMAMRRNEWRDWIGMSPDDEMDELLALENYLPADELGNQKKLVSAGKQTKPKSDPTEGGDEDAQ